MSNLNETLSAIATQLHTDAGQLIGFANEDKLGGYHYNAAMQTFPPGSVWGVEGQILYALTRHLKPEKVVEIGGWAGGSASHLALAVKANGKGHVYSIDDGSEFSDFKHGHLIPKDLQEYVTLIKDDGRVWLSKQEAQSIGLLFDDASHAASLIIELARLAMQKVYPTGVLVNHDAMHDQAYGGNGEIWPSTLGRQVRDALTDAGLYYTPYLTEPSDCGLAITVVPGMIWQNKQSEPKATEESINNSAAMAQYMGSANIESASEPPPVFAPLPPFDATKERESEPLADEDNPIVKAEVKVVEKKPRGKGGRKPKAQ